MNTVGELLFHSVGCLYVCGLALEFKSHRPRSRPIYEYANSIVIRIHTNRRYSLARVSPALVASLPDLLQRGLT